MRYNERQELEIVRLNNLQDKLQALSKKFFSDPILANTSNIGLGKYPDPIETDKIIQE